MWGHDGQGAALPYQAGGAQSRQASQGDPRDGIGRPDARDVPTRADVVFGDPEGEQVTAFPGAAAASGEAWQRVQTRQLIREFLRAVPRSEPDATLAFIRADGTQRILTRAGFSAAIDRLRPRQRQIVRLAIEERWPRQKVCAYLHGISIKTFERDAVEALDLLAQL